MAVYCSHELISGSKHPCRVARQASCRSWRAPRRSAQPVTNRRGDRHDGTLGAGLISPPPTGSAWQCGGWRLERQSLCIRRGKPVQHGYSLATPQWHPALDCRCRPGVGGVTSAASGLAVKPAVLRYWSLLWPSSDWDSWVRNRTRSSSWRRSVF